MLPTMPASARRTAMHKPAIAALGLAALLAGCAGLNPDYTRPAVDLPQAWRDAPAEGVHAQEAPWWKVYGDPVLDRLIEEALANNASVMLALARVDEARAALGATSAEQLPYVTAGANRNRTRLSRRGATPLPPGFDPEHNDTRVSADVSYEIDLWGRLRNSTLAFFFNDPATNEIYTLSLHDALPILDGLPSESTIAMAPFVVRLGVRRIPGAP